MVRTTVRSDSGPAQGENAYERMRDERIKRNQEQLATLRVREAAAAVGMVCANSSLAGGAPVVIVKRPKRPAPARVVPDACPTKRSR